MTQEERDKLLEEQMVLELDSMDSSIPEELRKIFKNRIIEINKLLNN